MRKTLPVILFVLLFFSPFLVAETLVPLDQNGLYLLNKESGIHFYLRESESYFDLLDESRFTQTSKSDSNVWVGDDIELTLKLTKGNITINIKDNSEAQRRLELVCLLDTLQGESGIPFYTADQSKINSEFRFRRNENPETIISLSDENKAAIAVNTEEISGANLQKIILVNTGIFSENPDSYVYEEGRSFSYFPDHVNDSSIVLFFYPQEIDSEGININIPYLDDYDIISKRYLAEDTLYFTREKMIKAGLEETDKLLKQVDDYLADEDSIGNEELEALKKILEEQKESLHEYEKL